MQQVYLYKFMHAVCAVGNHDKQPTQETQDRKAVLGIGLVLYSILQLCLSTDDLASHRPCPAGVALAAVLIFALTAGRESLEDAGEVMLLPHMLIHLQQAWGRPACLHRIRCHRLAQGGGLSNIREQWLQ